MKRLVHSILLGIDTLTDSEEYPIGVSKWSERSERSGSRNEVSGYSFSERMEAVK